MRGRAAWALPHAIRVVLLAAALTGAAPAGAADREPEPTTAMRQARATLEHATGDLAGARAALARATAGARAVREGADAARAAVGRTPCDRDALRRAADAARARSGAEADLALAEETFAAAGTHVSEIAALLAAYDAARAQAPLARLRALDLERAEIAAGGRALDAALQAWATPKIQGVAQARATLAAAVTTLREAAEAAHGCARPSDPPSQALPAAESLRKIIAGLEPERPVTGPAPPGYGTAYYVPEPPPAPTVPVLAPPPPPRSDRRCDQENEEERARCERERRRDVERALEARRAAAAADARVRALTREPPPDPGLPYVPPVARATPDPQAVARLGALIRRYAPPPPPAPAAAPFVPGQVIAALRVATPATLADLETRAGVVRLEAATLGALGVEAVLFEVTGTQTVPGAVAALAADPRVVAAQPNVLSATAADHRDPMATLQYGPLLIKAPAAHARVTGRGVRVAVIDTGVDPHHPDLIGRVAARANFAGGADAAEIHGTAVAGIIAATADNGIGIYGVAPEAAVLAARACRPRVAGRAEGVCTSWSLARALDWALARQARVVNLSVAGPRDPLLADLVARAHERGVVVVAAVGNLGPASEPTYPAALPTVVGVTAVDARAALYAAAVQGPFVSVAAPGVEVLSAQPGAGFAVLTGTSMAAAHVSGVAALLLQARADLGPAGVRRALEGHAQALGPGTGHGLVDGCRAVSDALGGRLGC